MILRGLMKRISLEGVEKIVSDVCLERKVRASLDAEAQNTKIYQFIKGRDCITTPHPGEFKRIFGEDPGNSLEEKIAAVSKQAASYGITIVLKGSNTVISDGSTVYVNKVGSAAMTCGGIGDTLSGVIGALLAQARGTELKSVEVAAAASYIVGLAGRKAAERRGFHIVSTDIINEISEVLKPFDRLS